jgi:hypothetical protein
MQVIKNKSYWNPTEDHAEDVLAGISLIDGFLFGYINPKDWRVISFHVDSHVDLPLSKGQTRVEMLEEFQPNKKSDAEINRLKELNGQLHDAIYEKSGLAFTTDNDEFFIDGFGRMKVGSVEILGKKQKEIKRLTIELNKAKEEIRCLLKN